MHFYLSSITFREPQLHLPDVCTESPIWGRAFCSSHCKFIEENNYAHVPTGLREFLKYCGIMAESYTSFFRARALLARNCATKNVITEPGPLFAMQLSARLDDICHTARASKQWPGLGGKSDILLC